jgi:Rne/Rng family ribonuclease
MSKEMVISANPHETRVAIMEEGQLCEYYVEREKEFALVGSIYKGRVTRVLPGMQSAFVEIGLDSDAFLYVTDFLEGIEEFEPIVASVEDKSQKMQEQGGQVFPANAGAASDIEPPDVDAAPPVTSAELSGAAPESAHVEQAPGAPAWTPPPANFAPPRAAGAADRGRFEGRQGRGGRDFGRRGRGGRFGGRRGGRSGDRRYGRELPPSKYASPRQYGESSDESTPSTGFVPVILPGESLARYKEQPPTTAAPVAPAEETPLHASPAPEAEVSPETNEPSREMPAPSESHLRATPPAWHTERATPPASGLEPLPGESLSKWRHDSAAPEPVQPAPQELVRPMESAAPPVAEEREEIREVVDEHESHEEHAPADLTDEEAAALAEHVAEAQSEEAERQQEHEEHADAASGESHEAESELGEERGIEAEEHESSGEDFEAEEIASGAGAEQDHESAVESEHLAAESASELGGEQPPQPDSERQPFAASIRDDFRARMQRPARRGRERDRDRGRRPHHGRGGHGYRPQPRRPQLIADMLKQGQEIIVQIAKEPLGKKGARITSHIALPGRYLVYMPTLDHSGVSRKIASAEERSRLRHLVNDAKGRAPGGFIVRTAAATAAPEEVRADVEFLTHTWSEIKSRSEQRKAPSLLHRDLNLVERILRDHMNSDYTAIWVDSEEAYTKVTEFISRFQSSLANRVKLYTKEAPIFEEFGIQQEIEKGLRPKVWLKSGGYIVINHTEALVAIDVNTGKFVGKGSNRLEDTIVRTNLEAAKEIVRQMRLRDLGGIIVIDFIDMEDRRNREKVMAALEDALRTDRAPSKMLRFNEFGLIAITRKRTKQALERTLCQPCPYCTGSGMVKSIPTLCYEIQTEARKMAPDIDSGSITLRVHPEIAKALKTRESSLIEELEHWTKKSAIIQADPTLHWEQYDIY